MTRQVHFLLYQVVVRPLAPCLFSIIPQYRKFHIEHLRKMPNRYTEVHENPHGAGDARPTGITIVEDENLVGKLSDKVVLITGVSSGIGIDTVRAMAHTGATVHGTVRNIAKGEKALSDILSPGKIELLEMDQTSLSSVRACAAEFLRRSPNKLHILICNAGIMMTPSVELTVDGHEGQFATNHLSHFLLFQLLKPALLASSRPAFQSRVVMVSSSGHLGGPPKFGDYAFANGGYTGPRGYAQSKTANIYMANHIERLYGNQGLHGLSLMPGGIATGLQVHMPKGTMEKYMKIPEVVATIKSTGQGASTTVYAAISKDWEGRGGRYLENCDEASPEDNANKRSGAAGYKAHAYDEENERRLWKDSLEIVGMEE